MKKYGIKSVRILATVGVLLFVFLMLPAKTLAAEHEDYNQYLRYSRLTNDARRTAYVMLVDAIEALEDEVFFPANTGILVSDIYSTFDNVSADFPEYFYAESVSVYGSGDGAGYWADIYYRMDEKDLSKEEVARVKSEVEGKIEEILSAVPADAQTDYDKALYIHDYLANNIAYEMVGSHQTIYGALVQGKCVCAGYANAYTVLMRRLGVKTWYIKGVANGERHAWNVSWIDGECVYTDVTWDDLNPGVRYDYFNISGEEMKKDHVPDGLYDYMLGTCTHTGHEYKPGPQKTLYINLRTSGLTLTHEGETTKILPIVGPDNAVNKAITFTSSNPSVVHVDADGTVTAVGEGTAIITVNSVDGGATASCPVVVAYPQPDPTTETIPVIPEETAPVATEQAKETVPAETTVPTTPPTTVPTEPSETTPKVNEPTATEPPAETTTNELTQTTEPFEIEDGKTDAESSDDTNNLFVGTLLSRMCLTLVMLILNAFGIKV